MASDTVSNDVSAIQPELWSDAVQIPLYKTLVAMDVCNVDMNDEIRYADVLNKPYFDSLSATTYTPGTAFTAQDQDWHKDQLTVDQYKTVPIYVDDVEQLQTNINLRTALQEEIAYQLRDAIDTHALNNMYSGAVRTAEEMVAGGTSAHAVSASTANVIDMFSKARLELRKLNVAENGDWISIVHPSIAGLIETKATSVGYNVADATLRNGYAGDFMGFKIYVSNNVPTGTSPSAGNAAISAANSAQIDANYEIAYFGKRGAIDLAIQKSPTIQIDKVSDKHGYNISAYVVYGSTVFTKNQSRFLTVATVGLN